MRLRLGLLQDQASIDRQIAKEAAEALAKKRETEIPTVKTEAETKAEESLSAKEKKEIADKVKSSSKPKIRPLSEAKAIDSGATFISETFLFGVALSTIIFESWRQRRKEANRRGDVADKLRELEEKDKIQRQLLEELQREIEELRAGKGRVVSQGGSAWYWPLGSKEKQQLDTSDEKVKALLAQLRYEDPALSTPIAAANVSLETGIVAPGNDSSQTRGADVKRSSKTRDALPSSGSKTR